MDGAYWSLVIEVSFYAWVTVLMATKVFPRCLDLIILIWLGITFANELTIDAPIFEKLFLADDSGFFAVGLVIYEFFRGRRDLKLYAIFALSVGTAVFQSLHKLIRLAPHTGGAFDHAVVVAICLASIAIIFAATKLRRIPVPAGPVMAIGGLTYPLYLLHMQLGYVFLQAFAPVGNIAAVTIIVLAIVIFSWIIWRFIERPAQRWTKNALTFLATRQGLAVSATQAAERTNAERSPA
jgi:peptidoglycan/LPS O-acetylase OafA/YrhL